MYVYLGKETRGGGGGGRCTWFIFFLILIQFCVELFNEPEGDRVRSHD